MAEPILDAPRVVAGVGEGAALEHRLAWPSSATLRFWKSRRTTDRPNASTSIRSPSAVPTAPRSSSIRRDSSLRWLHNAEPPDFEMVLLQAEPQGRVNTANLTLLGELRRRAPAAIDWGSLSAAGIVQMLVDFESARDSGMARRH